MKKVIGIIFTSMGLAMAGLAQAGAEVTPGGYHTDDPYFEANGTPGDLDPSGSGCFYIINAPTVLGAAFGAQMVFDGGAVYNLECNEQIKGKVQHKEGKDPVVKISDKPGKLINCVSPNADDGFIASFIFRASGKGDSAKLQRLQASFTGGVNYVFPQKLLVDNTACPAPAPAVAPVTAPGAMGSPTGG